MDLRGAGLCCAALLCYDNNELMLIYIYSTEMKALSGTVILSFDGASPNIGDLWCVAAAAASAMFILRLEAFAQKYYAAELNSISFVTGKSMPYK
jgi:drug/metabolite transporter (DMT)-like permease